MRKYSKLILAAMLVVVSGSSVNAEEVNNELKQKVEAVVGKSVPDLMGQMGGKMRVKSFDADAKKKVLSIDLSDNYGYVPFTKESIAQLAEQIKEVAGAEYAKYKVEISVGGHSTDKYLLTMSKKYARGKHEPFVSAVDANSHYKKGLDGNIIALWQSHGWYFEPKLNRWEWQRARVWQTVEDLYTQSYVMPFLMPMLENAGAYVISPRERDTQAVEVIVDNDGGEAQKGYSESSAVKTWLAGSEEGFAYKRKTYVDFENPFKEGTYRQVETTKKKDDVSVAHWDAEMPEAGRYAVYVSYKTLPNSASDALYTINHATGAKQIKVNQKMGGGTWIYLGHYALKKGLNKDVVTLSNLSAKKGVVTADAVKIGGGVGNVSRKVEALTANVKSSDNSVEEKIEKPNIDYQYVPSHYPRFTEAARYFLQWAGVPDSIYSPSHGVNDYTDDYKCRGAWVNYLAGGSKVLPNYKGLNIPVDLSFAFHTDAGSTPDDRIVGTLGIYYTNGFENYADGTPRAYSRLLTNKIMTNIVTDVRAQFEPNWIRRGMWDKSYFEARTPEVPAMLLELLSHHNFADMKYGLDPTFRFTVSRAIYKGMLEFIAERDGRQYQVQPLAVNSFAIEPATEAGVFRLSWKATTDTLTPNSDASCFIVCERVGGDADFKEIAVVKEDSFKVKITDNEVHSYKIIAMNDGGRSFDSEVLALGVAKQSRGLALVVNGFTRISAPDWFNEGNIAGFNDALDHGVPYKNDISFVGSQFEFRKAVPWTDDDASGYGASRSNYETKVIAGNTFDYVAIHGEAIIKSGFSFVSSSRAAVESGLSLKGYNTIDLILGKQKETQVARGAVPNRFKAFTPALREAIKQFTSNGGNVLVSGSFVATDIWDKKEQNADELDFAKTVLGYQYRVGQADIVGDAYVVPTPFAELGNGLKVNFNTQLNEKMYCVESPDAIWPASPKASTFMRYSDSNIPSAVVYDNGYRTAVIGFPIETITCSKCRAELVASIMNFFAKK